MHTTQIVIDEQKDLHGVAHHNSDYTGDVIIEDENGNQLGRIPFIVMQQLVAYKIQADAIRRIEDMDCWEMIQKLGM